MLHPANNFLLEKQHFSDQDKIINYDPSLLLMSTINLSNLFDHRTTNIFMGFMLQHVVLLSDK